MTGHVLKIEFKHNDDRLSAYIYEEPDSMTLTMKHNYLFQNHFHSIIPKGFRLL